jgi:hypothetical protein
MPEVTDEHIPQPYVHSRKILKIRHCRVSGGNADVLMHASPTPSTGAVGRLP